MWGRPVSGGPCPGFPAVGRTVGPGPDVLPAWVFPANLVTEEDRCPSLGGGYPYRMGPESKSIRPDRSPALENYRLTVSAVPRDRRRPTVQCLVFSVFLNRFGEIFIYLTVSDINHRLERFSNNTIFEFHK